MSVAHTVEDETDLESGNAAHAPSRPVTVLYGEKEIASFSTVGRAVGCDVRAIPSGARIVKGGVIKAKLIHAVSEKGHTYAGWLYVEGEKEKPALKSGGVK